MENLSTSMDQLVGLLKDRDSVKMSDAAKELDTTKEHIESWSMMLEKAGAIKVHYSVIGGAIIKKGPNFEEMVKKGIYETPPPPPKKQAAEEEAPAKPAKNADSKIVIGSPGDSIEAFAKPPSPKGAAAAKIPKDYALIRKRIAEGEHVLETDIVKMRQEQEKIIAYLDAIIKDSTKLTQYIDVLYKEVKETREARQQRAAEISK